MTMTMTTTFKETSGLPQSGGLANYAKENRRPLQRRSGFPYFTKLSPRTPHPAKAKMRNVNARRLSAGEIDSLLEG
jgi:hypothetical protein